MSVPKQIVICKCEHQDANGAYKFLNGVYSKGDFALSKRANAWTLYSLKNQTNVFCKQRGSDPDVLKAQWNIHRKKVGFVDITPSKMIVDKIEVTRGAEIMMDTANLSSKYPPPPPAITVKVGTNANVNNVAKQSPAVTPLSAAEKKAQKKLKEEEKKRINDDSEVSQLRTALNECEENYALALRTNDGLHITINEHKAAIRDMHNRNKDAVGNDLRLEAELDKLKTTIACSLDEKEYLLVQIQKLTAAQNERASEVGAYTRASQEALDKAVATQSVLQTSVRLQQERLAEEQAAHSNSHAHQQSEIDRLAAELQACLQFHEAMAQQHSATVAKLEASLAEAREKEKLATERADKMMSRSGKSYIKRDLAQTISTSFPSGDDYLLGFKKAFVSFDTFLTDAVGVVEDTGVEATAAASCLVHEVLVPLHTACASYIAAQLKHKKTQLAAFGVTIPENQPDHIDAVFWFANMQPIFLAQVDGLRDEEVEQLLLSPKAMEVHALMVQAAVAGVIEDHEEGTMRLPQLARHLLRSLVIAELSVPRCYLYPAPGQLVKYKEGFVKEVLSPGTKKHGRIKEGDEVEVVFSGLYFDSPSAENFGTMRPSEQALVRRIVNKTEI